MIRVDTIGNLTRYKDGLPENGVILRCDPQSLRGFGLFGQNVDLLPAGELAAAVLEMCDCEERWLPPDKCQACRLIERLRKSGMVEGSP